MEFINIAGMGRDSNYSDFMLLGNASIKILRIPTAIGNAKNSSALNYRNEALQEVTIKCFDLQGRRIFQKTFFSDNVLSFSPRNFQKEMPAIASKVYLMEIGVKDGELLKKPENMRRIVFRQ